MNDSLLYLEIKVSKNKRLIAYEIIPCFGKKDMQHLKRFYIKKYKNSTIEIKDFLSEMSIQKIEEILLREANEDDSLLSQNQKQLIKRK
jgi:hypothetical protein